MEYRFGTKLVRTKITSGGATIKIKDVVSYVGGINSSLMEVKILKCEDKQAINKFAYVPRCDFRQIQLLKRKPHVV